MMALNDMLRLFFFLSLVLTACKDEAKVGANEEINTAPTPEEMYFEDYVAPDFKWGFIDKDGEITITAKYDAVGKFSEGLAAANYRGKWGYIDRDDKTVIIFNYKAAFPFSEGLARVQSFDGEYHFIRPDGTILKTFDFIQAGDFSGGMARVLLANQWGFINTEGKLVVEPQFDKAWDFSGRHARIKKDGLYGLIDRSGNWLVLPAYDRISEYSEGLVRARKNNEVYYLDDQGVPRYGPFKSGTDFHDGHAFVISSEKLLRLSLDGNTHAFSLPELPDGTRKTPMYIGSGNWVLKGPGGFALIDGTGRMLTPFRYQQVNRFREGMAAYMRDDLWGYLDERANEVIEPVFGLAWDFSDGLARAAFREGIAYITKSMEPPFYPEFRDMQDFTEGLAAFQEL